MSYSKTATGHNKIAAVRIKPPQDIIKTATARPQPSQDTL